MIFEKFLQYQNLLMNFVKYHLNRLWFKITRNPPCCLATMSQQTEKATEHKRFDFMQIEEDFD